MKHIPIYILLSRIVAVIGMSFAIAVGILLLIAGYFWQSILAFMFFLPSIAIMAFLEKKADITWRE
jgi:hypothetical protein|tara:strand:+ start:34 stop:231 length:198 start_codon:yes stop_codon:yes gene_type:complete